MFLQTDTAAGPLPDGVSALAPDWNSADSAFIHANPRGYGYWLWKPLMIRALLDRLEDGAFLVYADGGCELSQQGGPRLRDYLNMAARTGALFFSLPFPEGQYAKRELLDRLSASEQEIASPQVQGTIMVLQNRAEVRAFVDGWIALCREDGYALLDDRLDPAIQAHGFRSHRHDQAILSLLVKRSGFTVIPWEDNYDKLLYWIIDSWVFLFPIHARRAQRHRLTWRMSGLSSHRRCVASAKGSLGFRFLRMLVGLAALRLPKS